MGMQGQKHPKSPQKNPLVSKSSAFLHIKQGSQTAPQQPEKLQMQSSLDGEKRIFFSSQFRDTYV